MKVADLFIKIGVEGANKTKEDLGSTRKTLGETASSALWAKAAIVGVLYGLERLVTTSNQSGAAMQSFANYTGLSAEQLQRYAYAGKQANASAEDVQGSIMGIQKSMAQLETTGQGPAGLWVISRALGGLDKTKMRDTFYMFDKLQEFARTTKLPTAIANQALESFGLSPGTIQAMRQNAFNPKALGSAQNVMSDKMTANLARMNAQWSNLGAKIAYSIAQLNSKHGGQLIKDITMIADKVLILTDRLVTLSEKLKFFQAMGKAFEGWGMIFGAAGTAVDNLNKKGITGGIQANANALGGGAPIDAAGLFDYMTGQSDRRMQALLEKGDRADDFKRMLGNGFAAPATPGATVQQTQNFYGPAEPKAVGKAAKSGIESAVSDAVWQGNKTRKN